MYREVLSSGVRRELAKHLDAILQGGPRLMITRHGRALAGLVSAGDLRALEAAEQHSHLYEDMKHGWRMQDQERLREALEEEARIREAKRGGGCLIR